jgi:S1-C subfamily serine protease
VKLTVLRDRSERSFDVTLDELKDEQVERASDLSSKPSLGIELADGHDGVVVQGVRPGSPAEGQLAPGDVIIEVNQAPVTHASEVAKRVEKTPAGSAVLFKVKRDGRTRFVAIERREG